MKLLIDLATFLVGLVTVLVGGSLALVAWAFAFSLPLALFWAAFRAWARLFGA